MVELKFFGDNPGAVQYGNFINYYHFNTVEHRLKLLPTKAIWDGQKEFFGLDIGCNSGDLTVAIHNRLKSSTNERCSFLGIDIDPILIERAKEKNVNEEIAFHCLDFMQQHEREKLLNKTLEENNITRFSACFCFSITMWIHLNHGDDGLQKFLETVCCISRCIVIEPQPWKCYRTAVKRMKQCNKEFPHFKDLKLRNNIEDAIESIITKCGATKIYESPQTQWGRKLLIFICAETNKT